MKNEKEGKSKMKTILMAFVAIVVSITIALCAAQIPGIINSTIDELINSGELESAIQDQVNSELESEVEKATGYTVSGVFVFNEVPSIPEDFYLEQEVSFTSFNTQYNKLYIVNALMSGGSEMSYIYLGTSTLMPDAHDVIYTSDVWEAEAYRSIDFGTTSQEVSEEFYTWLTANAVKQ